MVMILSIIEDNWRMTEDVRRYLKDV